MQRILAGLLILWALATIDANHPQAATFCNARHNRLSKFCFLHLDVPTRLRGGEAGDVTMADETESQRPVQEWSEEDVLKFLQGMKNKFGSKADTYVECFR
jgi:hypothetical protein